MWTDFNNSIILQQEAQLLLWEPMVLSMSMSKS